MNTSIEINGTNYPLKFGLGFMQAVNKKYEADAKEAGFSRDDGGLVYAMVAIIGDKSILTLVDVILEAAKSAPENQLKKNELVEWIENDDTDIDGLFKDIESFFEKANFCKKSMEAAKNIIVKVEAAEVEATE